MLELRILAYFTVPSVELVTLLNYFQVPAEYL